METLNELEKMLVRFTQQGVNEMENTSSIQELKEVYHRYADKISNLKIEHTNRIDKKVIERSFEILNTKFDVLYDSLEEERLLSDLKDYLGL